MTNINPGTVYISKTGDTFKTLASRAYGDENLWNRIYDANIAHTISDPTKPDKYAIRPGSKIVIPKLPELKRTSIARIIPAAPVKSDFDKEIMSVLVDNHKIEITRGKIHTALNTMADSWEIEIPWDIGADPELDELTKPFVYPHASAYVGQDLAVSGYLFDVMPRKFSGGGRVKSLRGYSYAKNVVDSNMREPYEFNEITLEELVKKQTQRFDISVFVNTDTGGVFDRITASEGQKISDFLFKLARQRGVLITSVPTGDLYILKPTEVNSVGIIEEGVTPFITNEGLNGIFSGQNRYHTYNAVGASPGWGQKQADIIDDSVPVPRFQTIRVDETTEGNIQRAVAWHRSKTVADALRLQIPVVGWYGPDGKIWRKNTTVTVKSPTLFIPDGFDFLIEAVEYITMDSGNTTILHIVPPQVYTGKEVKEPWKEQ